MFTHAAILDGTNCGDTSKSITGALTFAAVINKRCNSTKRGKIVTRSISNARSIGNDRLAVGVAGVVASVGAITRGIIPVFLDARCCT
mmetsp:Transcript_7035/g.11736  ORF Transcript_7035/g.11736 Transcript_7035/m.11736 type:complete len:88 (+) Transcript_7035:458-721(+)